MVKENYKYPSSPTNTNKGCLCKDGITYSIDCCTGDLWAQGIGKTIGTTPLFPIIYITPYIDKIDLIYTGESVSVYDDTNTEINGSPFVAGGQISIDHLQNDISYKLVFNKCTAENTIRFVNQTTKIAHIQSLGEIIDCTMFFMTESYLTTVTAEFGAFSKVTNLNRAWSACVSLSSFPLIDTSNVTKFTLTWYACTSLTSFPAIDTSKGTDFSSTWYRNNQIEYFPALDFRNGTNFFRTFAYCSKLKCFQSLNFTNLLDGDSTFYACNALVAPATTGTTVRNGTTALAGTWINSNPCPQGTSDVVTFEGEDVTFLGEDVTFILT